MFNLKRLSAVGASEQLQQHHLSNIHAKLKISLYLRALFKNAFRSCSKCVTDSDTSLPNLTGRPPARSADRSRAGLWLPRTGSEECFSSTSWPFCPIDGSLTFLVWTRMAEIGVDPLGSSATVLVLLGLSAEG